MNEIQFRNPIVNDNILQLSPIQPPIEYCKKWNERMTDFVVLTRNGELVSDHLYRIGGMGSEPDGENYFMLLKYVEAHYPADIMRMSETKDSKHLEGSWCILDKNGVEKVVCKPFQYPMLVKNSCIYSCDRNYYNIETGELYCTSYRSMDSTDYLFLDNPFDKDLSKRGVMQINKKDGSWIIFN